MTIRPVEVVMNDAHASYGDFVAHLAGRRRGGSAPNDAVGVVSAGGIAYATAHAASTLAEHYDCVILSPGPGRPDHPADMGIVLDVIRNNPRVPILGVCLGHQALGHVYGKRVKLAPRGPVHGLLSPVFYNEGHGDDDDDDGDRDSSFREDGKGSGMQGADRVTCRLFRGLPQEFNVVRYHSLVVDFDDYGDDDDESDVEPIAWCTSLVGDNADATIPADERGRRTNRTDDLSGHAICMALRHRTYPHYGVQFHPESIGTGYAGYRILRNFCDFVHDNKTSNQSPSSHLNEGNESNDDTGRGANNTSQTMHDDRSNIQPKYRVIIHKVDNDGDRSLPLPRKVFEEIYSSRPNSFWLDSSTGERAHFNNNTNANMHAMSDNTDEGCPIASNSRFSIMGSNDGPLSRKIEFFGREHDVERRGLRVISKKSGGGEEEEMVGMELIDLDILSYLRRVLADEREFVDHAEIIAFDENVNNDMISDDNNIDVTMADQEYSLYRIDEFAKDKQEEEALAGAGSELVVPFDYRGGYVGYLGYEVRHETQCRILEREGGAGCVIASGDLDTSSLTADEVTSGTCTKTHANIPTASFLFADRSLLYDHLTGDWYMIGITENNVTNSDHVVDTISWIRTLKSNITSMGGEQKMESMPTKERSETAEVSFVPKRSKAQYHNDISRSHQEIRNGESYELCVTNQLEAEIRFPEKQSSPHKETKYHESPFELYKLLRQRNPAPFSAFMNFYNDEGSRSQSWTKNTAAVSICCSSPERFLSVKKALPSTTSFSNKGAFGSGERQLPRRQFVVESKPIKGTAARYDGTTGGYAESNEHVRWVDSQIAVELSESVKDRAENLMIVDLIRSDLGRVCQVGSVHVPKLMQIESYATVHQMVSTVRGTLDGDNAHAIDVIEACFPGGSMTGAPKQRTMEILDEIERGVSRGPYSGCLGYISLNGCMDMNIVIRSAILTPLDSTGDLWKASVGCGGAITALSDSDDEYEEMLLKSRIVRRTISDWVARTTAERIQHRRHVDDSSMI
ncbi:hypothetical protein ACHAW5_003683 [Stephanodiscus triporus]|uniref:aminodeoxychorismate synthase n=1 Tax=Stephanodiscus triporus TaxID=2934178 RepID=A0ABD3QI74_9STRA